MFRGKKRRELLFNSIIPSRWGWKIDLQLLVLPSDCCFDLLSTSLPRPSDCSQSWWRCAEMITIWIHLLLFEYC